MISVTYHMMQRDPQFGQAMSKLVSTPVDQKTAYSIKKINDEFGVIKKKIAAEYQTEIIDVYANKNEKGELELDKENPGQFVPKENMVTALEQANDAFWNKQAKVDRPRLYLRDLEQIKFSAMELTKLEALYVDVSEAI